MHGMTLIRDKDNNKLLPVSLMHSDFIMCLGSTLIKSSESIKSFILKQ